MLQRWRAVGNTVFDLTGPRFEPSTSHSRDERITARPIYRPASWSSGNAFVSGAGGRRFKSRAGQFEHSVANGSPPLQHFFEKSCVARRRNDAEMDPANSLHASAYYREYNERFDFDFNFFSQK